MARGTFVALDGRDAEVSVHANTGQVTKIERKDKTANVHFGVEGLKHPIRGWISLDDPVFKLAEEALDQKREITFRIESQRKGSVNPSIPIEELRKTMEDAKENTILILAAINGELSNEAVTLPENDPASGGRVRATANVAPVSNGNNSGRRNNGKSLVTEEPPWKAFNSDGNPNLGSYAFSGVIGAESTARAYLLENDESVDQDQFGDPAVEDKVLYIARVLLETADSAQVSVPSLLSKADLNVPSHARARSVVYDSLKYVKFDVEDLDGWKQRLQELAVSRFVNMVPILFEGLGVEEEAEEEEERGDNTDSGTAKKDQPNVLEASGAAIFEPRKIDSNAEMAQEGTINALKELVAESKVEDMGKVSRILAWTFGTPQAANIPETDLGEMVDFYMTHDEPEENFTLALEAVWEHTER